MKPLFLPFTFLFVAQTFAQTPSSNATPALQVLSQQGPNLSSWVLAPIDRSTPDAIRQNVTFLREDLVDEGKTKPQASMEAYRVAHQFCSSLIAVLDEREKMLLKAGYRAVQANVVTPATNQALEARRNYLMSWPQYEREVQQRNELLRVGEAADRRKVELALQDLKLEWAKRAEPLRTSLDALYIKLRAALRDSGMTTNTFDGAQGGSPAIVPAMSVLPPPTVTPPAQAAPQGTFTNSLGMRFVPVPDTSVLFCIHEVRHSDYAAYAVETQGVDSQWWNQTHDGFAIKKRNGDHPVANVSWEDARKFCAWLSQKEGRRYRLPTDEEWSIAVGLGRAEQRPKGTTPAMLSEKENTEFPWGGDYPPKTKDKVGNYRDVSRKDNALKGYDDGYPTTAPVMNYKPNKFGLHDMGGNVWEWCEDRYDDEQEQRVLRGGSWWNSPRGPLLSSYRARLAPDERHYDFGFRVVLVVVGNDHVNFSNTTRKDPTTNVQAMPVLPPPTMTPTTPVSPQGTFTNSLGMKFVPVTDTSVLFCIHEVRYSDYAAYAKETQSVDGQWKNQTHDGFAITDRHGDHPVANVSWEDAQKFCAWLSQKEGRRYRLPTDEEWSIAVGLGRAEQRLKGTTPEMLNQKENTEFPWGGDFPPKTKDQAGNYSDASHKAKAPNDAAQYPEDYGDGFPTTAPVMSFKPNKLGLYDLGGNVWEWCEDWFDAAQKGRVLRGGSWYFYAHGSLLSSCRNRNTPTSRYYDYGFRVVLVGAGSDHVNISSIIRKDPTTNVPAMPVLPPPTVTPTVPVSPQGTFMNILAMKFVPVPGTAVLMCIHETRNADYAGYVAEQSSVNASWRKEGRTLNERHPVVNVSWEDAQQFCAWLSTKEGNTYRLPTDEEWSIAVGLGGKEKRGEGITPAMLSQKENTEFPWGDDFPPKTKDQAGNYSDASRKAKAPNSAAQYLEDYDDGFPTTAPVMSFKPNKFGLYDLGGNVWEWCEDWVDAGQKDRVLRGGCWGDYVHGNLLSSRRGYQLPGGRNSYNGFRVVLVSAGNGHANISNTTRKDPTANVPAMPVLPPPAVTPPTLIHPNSMVVKVRPNSPNGYDLGAVGKGEKLTLQFVTGRWKSYGTYATESPDSLEQERRDKTTENMCCIAEAAEPEGMPGAIVAVVPPKTETTPFQFTAAKDYPSLVLRILANSHRKENLGEAIYMLSRASQDTSGASQSNLAQVKVSRPPPLPAERTDPSRVSFVNSLGMQFVLVPETTVMICIHETRNADYAAFAASEKTVNNGWRSGTASGEQHPVTSLTYEDAEGFCRWLSTKERKDYRLPTDSEWSAAVGLGKEVGNTPREKADHGLEDVFPWGNYWPPKPEDGNYGFMMLDDGYVTTAPVMCFRPNALGIYDLGGNVAERCIDGSAGANRFRLLRGASWAAYDRANLRSKSREVGEHTKQRDVVGFRCVVEVDGG